MRILLFSIFLALFFSVNSQEYTISGTITDGSNGETMMRTIVSVVEKPAVGVATNSYGYYSLKLPEGTYSIKVKYLGYQEQVFKINLKENIKKDISIFKKKKVLKDVVISAKKQSKNVSSTDMGRIDLDLKQIEKVPVILGEKDVLKTIQLLPGIMPAQEGSAGFVVRGGSTDQNLILLDEAPVYNASHLLGFFSTFNSDALKDMTIYKGNMPAEYGGRLSSVLDVKMKEGNNKNFGFGGGIGLISSRLYAEGPVVKDKASFFVSGRRTYADAFLFLSSDSAVQESTLYFYDINAKFNYKIDKKNKLYFSGYFGKDHLGLSDLFSIKYGNTTATTRWNHVFNDRLFSNTSFIYNDFNYQIDIAINDFDLIVKSILNDYSLKQDFDYFVNSKNRVKFGFLSTWHNVVPGDLSSTDTIIEKNELSRSNGWENAIYIQNETKFSPKLTINYGLRLSMFTVAGKNTLYEFNDFGDVTDTLELKSFSLDRSYINPEPRLAINYRLNKNRSIKFSYSRNVQNIHQLSNTSASSPTDRWVLSTKNIRPGISDQASLGYYLNFGKGEYEASVETYYKILQNQIDYKSGTVLRANETLEKDLLYGDGRAFGIEFFLKKRFGRLNGWVSYTLARSERQFDGIDSGAWFPSRYDRTHDLKLVAMYDLSKKLTVSGTFVYYTGNATNYPSGKYSLNGDLSQTTINSNLNYNSYTSRNADRFPSYNRIDIGVTWELGSKKNWSHDLNFSVYNVLGTKNAYLLDFLYDDVDNRSFIQKTYLFSRVPAITYNFKFNKSNR